MLDINPIKKENNQTLDSGNQQSQSGQGFGVSENNHSDSSSEQKPLKSLNSNYLKNSSSIPEPEFLESKDASRSVFYFALVATFLVVGMAGYLYFAKKTKAEELKTKERVQVDIEAKIGRPELQEIDELASRYSLGLDQLSKLINNPIEYSLFFNELEKIVPTNVVLTSINIDEKNAYKISAKVDNLETSAKFVKSIENSSFFKTVFLSSNQLSSDKNNKYYTVSIDGVIDNKKLIAPKEDEGLMKSTQNKNTDTDLDTLKEDSKEMQ